jgi:hypothetical protein
MWNKMMARGTALLLSILVLGNIVALAQTALKDDAHSWSRSYEDFRKHIRPLTPQAKASCEKLLKEILRALDTKNKCSADAYCTLIDQDPFGATVPIRTDEAQNLKTKMKAFRHACDDGFSHSVRHGDIENIAVCSKNKCMVQTRFKKTEPHNNRLDPPLKTSSFLNPGGAGQPKR